MEWYKDYPHIGYDLAGKKILKPQTGDELDHLIEQSENPDYWYSNRITTGAIVFSADNML